MCQNFCRYCFNIKSIATNALASGNGSPVVPSPLQAIFGSEEGDEAMILIAFNAFAFIQHTYMNPCCGEVTMGSSKSSNTAASADSLKPPTCFLRLFRYSTICN